MVNRIQVLLILLLFACDLHGQEKYLIPFDYRSLTFDDFVVKAEKQMGVKFFYRNEWVEGMKLPEEMHCNSLKCLLDTLLRGSHLNYIIYNGKVVFTGNYKLRVLEATAESESDITPLTLYINSTRNTEHEEIKTITIGDYSERKKTGNVIISGYIRNRDTREPVEGVNIFIQKLSAGTITDKNGFYLLSIPRGVYQVNFTYIGMLEKKININLYGQGQLNVDMDNKLIELEEVIVSSRRNVTIERMETGAEKINISSVSMLPSSLGEADIIKNLNLIPGVQSLGEGSAGFNVRGGSEDQNLILLYGAPLYNSSHFFGFFSSINSDIIKDATLYKGGIPSRFGGRISSVLEIESKDGNAGEFSGNAGISPVAAHFAAEGPVIKDTLSYLFNLRATYSNWLLHLLKIPSLQNSEVSFNDFNGRITYKIDKNNKIDFSGYLSSDAFISNFNTSYNYRNNILAAEWRHNFNHNLLLKLSANNSFYKYLITDSVKSEMAYSLSHRINSTGIKVELNWLIGRNEINGGSEMVFYSVLPGDLNKASPASLIMPKSIGAESALETSLWIDDKLKVTDYLSLSAGIRLSSFLSFGPQSILKYDPGFSKTASSVTDTLRFGSAETTGRYAGPELRVSVNFRISDVSSFKINYNRTRQYIHLLSNTYSISPSATWKLCDFYLKPEIGDQYAFGLYHLFPEAGIEISAEGYYKGIKNMIDFKGGSSLTMSENIEQYLLDVKGKAYGMELAIKKPEGRIRYSIGYAYARSLVRSLGSFRDEIINSGNWYPSNYDKPNNFILTFHYLYSRRLTLSADYTYSTGRPITYPLATYRINDILMVQYSDRNKYRIPDYTRLDLSMKLSGNLKSRRIAHPWWIFSVYNLLSTENAYSVYFVQNGYRINGYKLSVFGRAIPSVTFSFDF